MNLPLYRVSRADVSSVSPSSERNLTVSRKKILVSAGNLMCFHWYLFICDCERQSCVGGNYILVLVFR